MLKKPYAIMQAPSKTQTAEKAGLFHEPLNEIHIATITI